MKITKSGERTVIEGSADLILSKNTLYAIRMGEDVTNISVTGFYFYCFNGSIKQRIKATIAAVKYIWRK